MCDMCDDPSLTAADLRGRLASMIASRGWAIQFVEGEGHHPSLAYTIGLTDFGLPELAANGLTMEQARQLNQVAQDCVDGLSRVGTSVEVGGRLFRLVALDDTREMLGALGFYGSRLRALRLRPMRR